MKKTNYLHVRVTEELHSKLMAYCKENEKDASDIIRDLIKDFLKNKTSET